ncbi:MAG: hypothetical protein ABI611_10955 [Solirubrobacteraceae bacterium]
MVTHPEFTSQDLSIDDQRALAGRGALLERCFTTPTPASARGSTSMPSAPSSAPTTRGAPPATRPSATPRPSSE